MPVLSALPVIPGVTCPSPASSLGGIGLGTVCQVASGVTGAATSVVSGVAGSAVSSVAGFGVDTVLNALGSWVSSGATWLLGQIGSVLTATTSIDLSASWFTTHYQAMAALAGVVVLPLLLLGIIQSVYRQSASALARSVLVNVPLAVLLTAVAVKLVSLGLALTDAMSEAVASGSGLDAGHFMTSVTLALSGTAVINPGAPAFILFLGSLAVVFGAVMLWIELLIRSAAVYVAVLFLPLALASLAWPTISHWCRRLVDTLVALILGKFVIVSVLSLAAGALDGAGGTDGGGFSAVLGGAALLFLSALAPWTLFRLLPFVEAGAVGHLEGLSQRARRTATAPVRGLATVAMEVAGVGSVTGAAVAAVGGALGRSGGTDGTGGGGSGAGRPRPGGPGPGAPGPGGADAGHDRSGDPTPDLGPSSAERTGVGTATPPAYGIPAYPAHPEASARARRNRSVLGLDGTPMDPIGGTGAPQPVVPEPPVGGTASAALGAGISTGTGPGAPPDPVGSGALVPLPLQSGTTVPDFLGRDRLGPRLIAGRQPPAHRPSRVDPDA